MRRIIKTALVLLIASVCFVGALFSRHETAPERDPSTPVVPVKNAHPHRGIGLRV